MRPKAYSLLLTAALLVMAAVAVAPLPADADAAGEFTIIDSTGAEIVFDGPAEHVVTLGAGYTDTVIQLGHKDRIVAVDTYSTYEYTGNKGFKGITNDMSLGSPYSKDDSVVLGMLQLIEKGSLGKDDAIIMPDLSPAAYPDINRLDLELAGYGCKIVRLNATTYDEVAEVVTTIGRILGDADNTKVLQMQEVRDRVTGIIAEHGLSGAAGIHISSMNKVYNNSILVSMIEIANGINAGFDPGHTSSASYTSDGAAILQMSELHENTTVFIDSGYKGSVADFRNENRLHCNVIKMGQFDNNISPSAAEALWKVASALYPDVFEGEESPFDEPSDNSMTYLAVGIAAAAVLVIAAVAYLRR